MTSCAVFGSPASILSDRGQQFMSIMVKELCNIFQIVKINTSSYHPQTNSRCENFNRVLLSGIRTQCDESQTDWNLVLNSVLLAYRTRPDNRSTKHSPFMLMYGDHCKLPIDVALPTALEKAPTLNEHVQENNGECQSVFRRSKNSNPRITSNIKKVLWPPF